MYPKVEPASISKIESIRYLGHNTICEKIRKVYSLTDNEEIKYTCREILAMAKKMHERLKKYKEESLRSNKSVIGGL